MATTLQFPSPPLAGAGFVLRPLGESDYEAAWASREHPETVEWVNALPEADGERMIRLVESSRHAGRLLHFAIADDEHGGYLGEILLFLRTPEAGEVGIGEIAYVVAPAARGRGFASAAVRALSVWAFHELRLERLQLSIRPDNVASRRVADKAGYAYEGTLRSSKLIRGRRVDAALYSLLPNETSSPPT
jgi:RimJ/RimL family protein N-acetyltransferase